MADARAAGSRASGPSRTTEKVLHRRYGCFTLGVILFIVALSLLEQRAGWTRSWIGAVFLLGTVAVYAIIGLFSRTIDETEYYVAGRRVPAMYNGMATAADWMSAASFIGTAGVLYLQGFYGLAYILGWTGGYCLVAFLLAPYLRRFGQYTIPDFIGARYGGTLPRIVSVTAVVIVSFVYVVVQMHGVGLIASHLTGISFEIGILICLGGILVCSFLGGMRAVTWTQVAQYIVLIIAYLVPVFWLAIKQTGQPVPMIAYGTQLTLIAGREQELIEDPAEQQVRAIFAARAQQARDSLADVPASMERDQRRLVAEIERLRAEAAPLVRIQQLERRLAALPKTEAEASERYRQEAERAEERARPLNGMPRQMQAYAAGDPAGSEADRQAFATQRLNFLALTFCLMLGTAAMPHILTRSYTTCSAPDARRSVAWSLFFIVLLYIMAPTLAVMVKYEVFTSLVGMSFDELPSWIRRWNRLDTSLVRAEDVNGDGLLQLAELQLAEDVIVLAAPEIGGLPAVVAYLVAAGGLAAALSTADGLLLTIANAGSHDIYYRLVNPRASAIRRVMLSKVLVLVVALLAAFVATLKLTNILQFVSAAFSLAAAAFFPALTLGIFWRRANAVGATLGMLAGLGVCLYYMSTTMPWLRQLWGVTRPLEDCLWWGISPLSAGVFGVPVGYAVIIVASLLTRPPAPEEVRLIERIRHPEALLDGEAGAA